jgi:hypothetical protein
MKSRLAAAVAMAFLVLSVMPGIAHAADRCFEVLGMTYCPP